jgi:hypothetical protein
MGGKYSAWPGRGREGENGGNEKIKREMRESKTWPGAGGVAESKRKGEYETTNENEIKGEDSRGAEDEAKLRRGASETEATT